MREYIVVPSRAGTKNKGLWKVAGRPLVEWVLRVASEYADATDVIVTTDQPRVIDLAGAYGARVRVRPEHLRQGDKMPMTVLDAIEATQGKTVWPEDIIHVLQPTSPFVTVEDLEKARAILEARPTALTSCQSVHVAPHNYHRLNSRQLNGEALVSFESRYERLAQPTHQDKPPQYAFGNLISVRLIGLWNERQLFTSHSAGFVIPRWRAWDVDTEEDRVIATALVKGHPQCALLY